MSKKTFSVEELKNSVNSVLANSVSEYCSADYRQGMMNILEMVLHQTSNYRGFTYLNETEVPSCSLPGIIINGTIEDTLPEDRFPEGKVDSTRVRYF